jgi:hypothetical protein
MRERPALRRRLEVVLVVLIAAGATIATSPARVESRLEAHVRQQLDIESDRPHVTGQIVLTMTPEALTLNQGPDSVPTGSVMFTLRAERQEATSEAGGPVELTVRAVGVSQPSTAPSSGQRSWPIDQLCRAAEPCSRTFEVSVEWLHPVAGESRTLELLADLDLRYRDQEQLPAGAQATLNAATFEAGPAAPTVGDQVDLGSVRIWRDAPFAARHVIVRTAAVNLAPADEVEVSAFLTVDPQPKAKPDISVTIVPDADPERSPYKPGDIFDPLEGCRAGAACTRGFTVIAQWTAVASGAATALTWSFDALARFPGVSSLPDGAGLTVDVDKRVDVSPESPRIEATASGTLLFKGTDVISRGETLLILTGPPRSAEFLGAPPPAVAQLTFRAGQSVGAAAPSPSLSASVSVTPTNDSGQSSKSFSLQPGGEARAVLIPFAGCRGPDACQAQITIQASTRDERVPAVSWELSVSLGFGTTQPPPGAHLQIRERGAP